MRTCMSHSFALIVPIPYTLCLIFSKGTSLAAVVATGTGGAMSYAGAEAVDWEVGREGGREGSFDA